MPALNFLARFADDVEHVVKTQTIRKRRKRPIKAGDRLYLYTGMRTDHCRRLGVQTCTETFVVRRRGYLRWWRGNHELSVEEIEALAKRDGFSGIDTFDEFFKDYPLGKPLDVIRW